MDYPFTLPGHPELNLALRTAGFFAGPKIIKNGVALVRKKGIYSLPLADGSSLTLKLKVGLDLYAPKIEYAGQVIEVIPALPVFWSIWGYVPLVGIPFGGALGGAFCVLASITTFNVLHSKMPSFVRYALALVAPLFAFVIYLLIVIFIIKLK